MLYTLKKTIYTVPAIRFAFNAIIRTRTVQECRIKNMLRTRKRVKIGKFPPIPIYVLTESW